MIAHRRSKIAGEGWPWLLGVGFAGYLAFLYGGVWWVAPFALLGTGLYFLFRDPGRAVLAEPLAALAPVDGKVVEVTPCRDEPLPGDWIRVVIATNHMGAYTVRSPIEGTIHDVTEQCALTGSRVELPGMWLRSEEAHDVVLTFPRGLRWLGPKAFVRYGERLGQGYRFAYLRLAPRAEIFLPAASEMRVAAGEKVVAGETIMAILPG